MNLLLHVTDLISGDGIVRVPCAFLELTPDLANGLLDHYRHFKAAKRISRPPLLWSVLGDSSARFLSIPADDQTEKRARLTMLGAQAQQHGIVELPDELNPRADNGPLAKTIDGGLDPHLVLNDAGVSWGLLFNDRPLGTALVPFTLIEVAAGIKIRDDSSVPFPTATL